MGEKRESVRTNIYGGEALEHLFMSYAFTEGTDYLNAIISSCKTAGFSEAEFTNKYFNLLFSSSDDSKIDWNNLNKYQKINQFPHAEQLSRKDLLWKNNKRLRDKHQAEFDIVPTSYTLSDEIEAFQEARQNDPDQLWILKPVLGGCDRSARIINNKTKILDHLLEERHIVSKYINNPHLINGYKYDLRIYVLVSSYTPLKVYIYKQGLVRFATKKYSNDLYMHLTNIESPRSPRGESA